MYDYRILTFVKAAQHKSFSSAAEGLNLSTSAVTKQISTLEKEWKTVLFTRTNSGIELTEDGKYLYQKAIDMINEANTILDGLPSRVNGKHTIKIANCQIAYSKSLRNIVDEFCNLRTDCVFKGVPYFKSSSLYLDIDEILKEYDMVFYINECLSSDLSIEYIPICYTPLVCAVNTMSDLNKYSSIGKEELKGHTVGFFSNGLSEDLNKLRSLFETDEQIHLKDINYSITLKEDDEVIVIPEVFSSLFTFLNIIPMTPEFKITSGLYYRSDIKDVNAEFIDFCEDNFKN